MFLCSTDVHTIFPSFWWTCYRIISMVRSSKMKLIVKWNSLWRYTTFPSYNFIEWMISMIVTVPLWRLSNIVRIRPDLYIYWYRYYFSPHFGELAILLSDKKNEPGPVECVLCRYSCGCGNELWEWATYNMKLRGLRRSWIKVFKTSKPAVPSLFIDRAKFFNKKALGAKKHQ